ncbi:MAG: GTP-binding protein [Rikenellaceae bacterium]
MEIVAFAPKVPIILVTGFLGSGKTSLLAQMLRRYVGERRVAVVQNEFAASSIDGEILRGVAGEFEIRELNSGSIFCACLFSHFKNLLKELSHSAVDMVVVEATGIADPIAIAQLMEDEELSECYYLSRIISVVDAPRFLPVLANIIGVRHQVQVADMVVVNKVDLVDVDTLSKVRAKIAEINPVAKMEECSYAKMDVSSLFDGELSSLALRGDIRGALTKCGDGVYTSKCFKSTLLCTRESLDRFLSSLDDTILRLKGYVTLVSGESVMIQYLPGQIVVAPMSQSVGRCELISIGFSAPDFKLLSSVK